VLIWRDTVRTATCAGAIVAAGVAVGTTVAATAAAAAAAVVVVVAAADAAVVWDSPAFELLLTLLAE